MAGNKTNSNSITAIFVDKLNYKKSGFRAEMLKILKLPDDVVFKDSTHNVIPFPEMGNAEVDIAAYSGKNVAALIEIKANQHEDLQPSQKKNGEYEKTAKAHNIGLFYVIPENYDESHKREIPDIAEVISWTQIFRIAWESDNTGFANQIEYFVDSTFKGNDLLINKGELAMYLSPEIIGNVMSLDAKLTELMENFTEENPQLIGFKNQSKTDGFGRDYILKDGKKEHEVRIGLAKIKETDKNSFFITCWLDNAELSSRNFKNFVRGQDYFLEDFETGSDLYLPAADKENPLPEFLFCETVDDEKQKFNAMMTRTIEKFFEVMGESSSQVEKE